jgi:hypothetical protein
MIKIFILTILCNFKNAVTKNITKFLDHCNLTKIYLMDFLNYFHYRVTDNKDVKILEKIGFASILIKYKFTGIAYEYDKIELVKDYGPKIYLNVTQFGIYAKNNYFKNYIKDAFGTFNPGKAVLPVESNFVKPKVEPKIEQTIKKSIFDEPSEKVEKIEKKVEKFEVND